MIELSIQELIIEIDKLENTQTIMKKNNVFINRILDVHCLICELFEELDNKCLDKYGQSAEYMLHHYKDKLKSCEIVIEELL